MVPVALVASANPVCSQAEEIMSLEQALMFSHAQFLGRKAGTGDLFKDIHLISGSRLSTSPVINGIQRILATYALVLARRPAR